MKDKVRTLTLVLNFHPDWLDVPAAYINPKGLLALLTAEGDHGHSNPVIGLGLRSFHEGDIRKGNRLKRGTTREGQDEKDSRKNQSNPEECAHVTPFSTWGFRNEASIGSAACYVNR